MEKGICMKNDRLRKGVVFDMDGTLVDSNDSHAHSWIEAMQDAGHSVPFDKVRPLIGMGGDKVLPEVLHIQKDSEEGKQISQRRKEIFKQKYLPTLKAFPRTKELLEYIHEQGLKMIIATSAEPEELDALFQVIGPGVDKLFEEITTSQDAPQSKPDPDIMHAAIERAHLEPHELVMLGDTPYDIDAATKVSIDTIAFSYRWLG